MTKKEIQSMIDVPLNTEFFSVEVNLKECHVMRHFVFFDSTDVAYFKKKNWFKTYAEAKEAAIEIQSKIKQIVALHS